MIDLFLWAKTPAILAAFARANHLQVRVGDITDQDPESPTFGKVTTPDEWQVRHGLEWNWWAGNPQFMVAPGAYDAKGVETKAPTYNGVGAILRIHADFFEADKREPDADEKDAVGVAPDWARSKVMRYIKTNGVPGKLAGLNYYELGGVRLMRLADVQAWCATRGVPSDGYL